MNKHNKKIFYPTTIPIYRIYYHERNSAKVIGPPSEYWLPSVYRSICAICYQYFVIHSSKQYYKAISSSLLLMAMASIVTDSLYGTKFPHERANLLTICLFPPLRYLSWFPFGSIQWGMREKLPFTWSHQWMSQVCHRGHIPAFDLLLLGGIHPYG